MLRRTAFILTGFILFRVIGSAKNINNETYETIVL
jgi:hypothetical protein